ncbi:MAG: co-chaperone GroES family protein [Candidatus Krumholzibacteriia bacterium]
MPRLRKKLIVVGDRILVRPEEGEERTGGGLYLPQTAISARQAGGGWVVTVGPGLPVAEPADLEDDDWHDSARPMRYLPLQAQEGDYCLFLKKAAVEITFEKKNYLIVPNAAVLVLVREDFETGQDAWELADESGESEDAGPRE